MCCHLFVASFGVPLFKGKKLSPQTRKLLDAAPGCVMVSVVAPAFMTTNPADLVTLIVVVFLAKKLNLAVMTALAVALNALLRHLF